MRVCRVTRIQAHVSVVLLVAVPVILSLQFLDFDFTALDEFGQVQVCARIDQQPDTGSDMGRDAPARDRYFAQRISAIIILDHDDLKDRKTHV